MLAFSHEDKKDAIKRWWKKRIWKRVRARNQRLGTPWVREIPPTHPEDLPTLRDANRPDTNDY